MFKENVLGRVLVATGLMMAIIGIFGCGRKPPAGFWEPDAADSAAIRDAVLANKELLQMRFTEDGFQYLEWLIADSIVKKAIKDNPFKQRYKCDSMRHIFSTDSIKFNFSFTAVVDTAGQETTATVTVVETIPGFFQLHAIKYTRFVKDSVIVTPSETIRLPYYDTVFTDTSMLVEKPIYGVVLGGCVLRKESGEWKLWKLAGGQRFYAPNPNDAPYLVSAYLTNGVREDTINLRPDTLHFGMQRLYEYPDGLLSYNAGDSILVRALLTAATDAMNFVFFKGIRYRMATTNKIALTESGLQRIYVEQIPFPVFYDAGGELNAVVWGIPINVKGGGQ
ncbi:MAG: hypothetical protein ACUVUD_04130 [bacterium]